MVNVFSTLLKSGAGIKLFKLKHVMADVSVFHVMIDQINQ